MLNLGFSVRSEEQFGARYSIPEELAAQLVSTNADFSAGPELRLQPVFGDELWDRIAGLGLGDLDWKELDVLDVCAGAGFLSFHLLARTRIRSLTLVDVARDELKEAEELLMRCAGYSPDIECSEVTNSRLATQKFDVVIGNSFAHHFPDVPHAFDSIYELLKPGGWFIGLHEPTPAAVPLESGDFRHVAFYLASRRRYLARMRFGGLASVKPGTTDIWMFEGSSLRRLLQDAGFRDVQVVARYLARPFVVAALNLHLSSSQKRLSSAGIKAIDWAVKLDRQLARVLPGRFFGGLSFAARR